MVFYPIINLVDAVIDEIALEGLDGITLEALWNRLAQRLNETLPFTEAFMEQIWSICLSVQGLLFYELPAPRDPLVIFDRYELIDPELGTILEPATAPKDIYPFLPINDVKRGIKGSCSTYESRRYCSKDVKTLSLQQAIEKYYGKLVIVATQQLREKSLMGETANPVIDLNIVQFCFLERVGRSRYHGEVTQGKVSLAVLKEDPKSLFYHRKSLLQQKLITKQLHHQKDQVTGHCSAGSLLHLTRFYVERKPKVLFLAEKVIELLKNKENYIAEYDEIKAELQIDNCIKKLLKTSFFQRVIKADVRVPYRMLYPHAEMKEWQMRNEPSKERWIRVVQLIDPNIDVNETLVKEEVNDEDEVLEDAKTIPLHEHLYNVPLLKIANKFVEAAKDVGVSQHEFSVKMGLTKLHSRQLLRNLVRLNVVASFMVDVGRQRVTKYMSKKYERNSEMSRQFKEEVDRMKQLTKKDNPMRAICLKSKTPTSAVNLGSGDDVHIVIEPDILTAAQVAQNPEPATIPAVEESKLETKEAEATATTRIEGADASQEPDKEKTHKFAFKLVNGILSKYRATRICRKYKYTSKMSKVDSVVVVEEDDVINDEIIEDPTFVGDEVVSSFVDYQSDTNPSNVTYRLLKRSNIIIETVKELQVIDDATKLLKMINEEEEKEGYGVRIDKKSLFRLLKKLANDKLVKNIKVILSSNGREKALHFICDPRIDKNHTVIQSKVEQAKIKFNLAKVTKHSKATRRRLAQQENQNFNIMESPSKNTFTLKYDSKAGKRYGYHPKFVRMQTLHLYMYHLIYDHPGEKTAPRQSLMKALQRDSCTIDSELMRELSPVYSSEINWKMFVPPLPNHAGWGTGWALVCDLLLRIPLSIFVKVINVTYDVPGIEHYLDHPVRKHFLVKDLPQSIRNVLLYGRKYIYSFHESITRLCYVGLLQFGAQKLKEKDQVFIYLNRHTQVLDTTSTAASYHKIEDKDYPVTMYTFESMQVVEKYWYDVWNICLNTDLGGRLAVEGKDIVLEDLAKKDEMIAASRARTTEEAVEMDNGLVPGDHRGAAGLDSAFFAHLKRNWSWGNVTFSSNANAVAGKQGKKTKPERSSYFSKLKAKPVKFNEFSGLKKITGPAANAESATATKKSKKPIDKSNNNGKQQQKTFVLPQIKPKQTSRVRTVKPRNVKKRKKVVKYDEIDYCALQKMEKLRVNWESHEDKLLLICKIATAYLCPNSRKQMIPFSMHRNVLRHYYDTSHNKTSRACQRRLLYMLKDPVVAKSVNLGVEEISHNNYVNKRFDGIVAKLKVQHADTPEYETKVSEVFFELVSYIAKKSLHLYDSTKQLTIFPRTIQEFNLLYKIVPSTKHVSNKGFTKDIQSIGDIHAATVNAVIHSSMCCGKDRRSWAYQLIKVYQKYPESLLREAMQKIRGDQMISIKKSFMSAMKSHNYMPMSNSQFQLSSSYVYKFHTKWPYRVFTETYDVLSRMVHWYQANQNAELNYTVPSEIPGIEVSPASGAIVAAIHNLHAKGILDFDVEIPDQIIMLDPRLPEKDEIYQRIAKRYAYLLSTYEERQNANLSLTDKHGKKLDDGSSKEDYDYVPGDPLEEDEEDDDYDCEDDEPTTQCYSGDESKAIEESVEEAEVNSKITIPKFSIDSISSGTKRTCASVEDQIDIEDVPIKRPRVVENPELDRLAAELAIMTENRLAEETDADNLCPLLSSEQQQQYNLKKVSCQIPQANAPDLYGYVCRVNEVIKNVYPEQKSGEAGKACDNSQKYTRIALLKMREELSDLAPSESHHAHDFFVVSMFKIFCTLQLPSSNNANGKRQLESFQDCRVPVDVLPLTMKTVNDLLEHVRKFAVYPKNHVSYAEFKSLAQQNNLTVPWDQVDTVYKYIKDCTTIGASVQQLAMNFEQLYGRALYDIIELLTENRLILRTGVTSVRYVHQSYTEPWLIRTPKIVRLEKESYPNVPKGAMIPLEDGNNENGNEEEAQNADVEMTTESEESGAQVKRSSRKRTLSSQQKNVYQEAKEFDFNTEREEVKVVIRPWIRVDGVLNRRVLDRMLGAVLAYCMLHPGVSLLRIQNRFSPALQYFHTRELVEMLIKLECLQMKGVKKPRVTLFSKPKPVKISVAVESLPEDELIVEPTLDSTLKFSVFLSNKLYSSDFLA